MQPRPNILWIVTTQWRAQACGYAGDRNARTPNLDRLAAQSVNFCAAVTPHPFGPFARAAMLTGLTSPRNGVRDYFDPLPASARTIAHEFAAREYTTGFVGKWHLWRRDRGSPLVGEAHAKIVVPPEARGGFDFWEGFESGFLLNDPWLHGTNLSQPTRFPGYQSDVLAERVLRWIRSVPTERPWLAMVSLEAPHPPYDAPTPIAATYEPSRIDLAANVPLGGAAEAKARVELAGYYAHIEATDRAIGRLIDRAGDGIAVVFTSVHGDMHGAHGLFRKGWPHEESIRVPLLIRAPDVAACVDHSPVSLLDLGRMTLDVADRRGVKPSHANAAFISMPSVVELDHQCDRRWHGVRTRTRKLVLQDDNGASKPWLFFDLENDPLELSNVVGEPQRAAEIAELLRQAGERLR